MHAVFEELLGLPTHPLMVHAAVVFTPCLALVAVGYSLLPPARARLEPVVVVLAVVAPLAVGFARESGAAFRRRLTAHGDLPPNLAEQADTHADLSRTLLLLTIALAATTIGLVLLQRSQPHTDRAASPGARSGPAPKAPPPGSGSQHPRSNAGMATLLTIVIIVLSSATIWYVAQTGHSGSSMVWKDK